MWDELLAHGDAVRNLPFRDDAEAVARETMLRVRRNVENLVAGLKRHGFEFGRYPDGEVVPGYAGPLVPPSKHVESELNEIESLVGGPLPLALVAFWRYVGSVNLVGAYPDWPDGSDPLWVDPPAATIDEFPNWLDRKAFDPDERAFGAQIAPDSLHKDNVSGGLPYEILLPNAAIDGELSNEGSGLYFVEYLRQALDWGGFPGFASDPDGMPAWLDKLSERVDRF